MSGQGHPVQKKRKGLNEAIGNSEVIHRCYFTVSECQPTKVEVDVNEDIDSIKEKIKLKLSPHFNVFAAVEIELHETSDSDEPLDSTATWSPDVTWGTKAVPLIIKVRKINMESIGKNDCSRNNTLNFHMT
jgi:hypothetical protein